MADIPAPTPRPSLTGLTDRVSRHAPVPPVSNSRLNNKVQMSLNNDFNEASAFLELIWRTPGGVIPGSGTRIIGGGRAILRGPETYVVGTMLPIGSSIILRLQGHRPDFITSITSLSVHSRRAEKEGLPP
jgi:hypothetical protein